MRTKRSTSQGLTVRAFSGTHVVLLAFDLSPSARSGCLGFSIKRRDETENEEYWLQGLKTFASVEPAPGPGVLVSTHIHPLQGFQWMDYTAKPAHSYTYEVTAMRGTPKNLQPGPKVAVKITTETAEGDVHEIHFNRGAVASQEYARRFQNKRPDQIADGSAYKWLSRGLEEALIAFIQRASGPKYSLRAAIYEFQWPNVLAAFKAAGTATGGKVKIVYDAVPKATGPKAKNVAAIGAAGIGGLCIPRTKGTLMHNKFIVLLKDAKPVAVWTGSTNVTLNGIFGHLNVGHAVNDPQVAQRYLDFWNQLQGDPTTAELKTWADANDPLPAKDSQPQKGTQVYFSPHRGLDALHWYAHQADANAPDFITLAFGMHEDFKQVYRKTDGLLRVALLEKPGNGAGLAQGRIDIQKIRKLPNVLVAIGNYVMANKFDRWLKEIDRVTAEVNVRWVHTKFLMIDPLGADPVVVTGSANFSEASTSTNEENVLVIRGNTRVADIYFTEFLRVYSHHAFRESLSFAHDPATWKPQYLIENATWQKDYFKQGNERYLRRLYYAGS